MAVALGGTATAQEFGVAQKAERIGEYVSDAMDKLGVPGASLALVHEGELVYAQGWGVTGGAMHDVTAQTPFLIGSNSKALTAFGIMRLTQNEEIHLDEPIREYIPWFSLNDDGMGSEVTIRQLISHTSGIGAYSGFKISDHFGNSALDIEAAVRSLSKESPISRPGQVYEYSAANYAILGAVIEQVSGVSFAEFMDVEVFQPLAMDQAAADLESSQTRGWEPGYRSWFGIPVAGDPLFDRAGAPYGYISASAEDMARFLIALQRPGQVLSVEYSTILLQPITATGPDTAGGCPSRQTGGPGSGTAGLLQIFARKYFCCPQPAGGWHY